MRSILAVLCILASHLAQASVIYDYIGKEFTGSAVGAPNGLTNISGYIELAEKFSLNLTGEFITPISFSFFDGLTTLTNTTPGYDATFQFTTTATGGIFDWRIFISNNTFPDGMPHTMEIRTQGEGQFIDSHWAFPVDEVNYCTQVVSGTCLNNTDTQVWDAGAWYLDGVAVSPIPLPATTWLFLSAIAGLYTANRIQEKELL